ncbi:MAG TPA: acyl-CoA dehydrogenase family protein [Acidimicrobiales bacterium]|nr:acyl-CoA dehydrogenase family protein [Acidimicrobiales bacterium]
MDLALTDDQLALRDAVVDLLTKESPPERVRAAEPTGFDPELWALVAGMGLPSLTVPEAAGGGGGSMVDLALVLEEFGRRVAAVPLVEAAAATDLLAHVGASALLDEVLSGPLLPTLALRRPVSGVARLVPAGAVADVVVALDGDALVAVRSSVGPGAPLPVAPNLGSAPLADRRLDDGTRTVLLTGAAAGAAYERSRAVWQALLAAELVGLAAAALDMGVAYVKQRRAFGVHVGWFQSVQHRLADVALQVDGARLLAYEAAWAFDAGLPNAASLASMAYLYGSEAAFHASRESLQFHGGYGYTLEYDIQLYFRRAKAWPLAWGDPRGEYQRLAALLFEHRED